MQSPSRPTAWDLRFPPAPVAPRLPFDDSLTPANTSPTLVSHPPKQLPSVELEDPPSSDPVEQAAASHPFASFNQSLQSHLAGKPLWPATSTRPPSRKENWPLPSSSSSPCSSSAGKVKRRGVVFSNTPLGSLNASPKHTAFFHPYHHSHRRRIAIYSDTSSSSPSSAYSSPPTSTSPAARPDIKRVGAGATLALLPLLHPAPSSPPSDEEEAGTDDEAEETIVEALLLTQDQIANSPPKQRPLALPLPLAPFTLPSPSRSGLRSILKKDKDATILLVEDAAEGSKRNGRRKHAISFDDCFKELPAEVPMTELAGGSGRKATAPAKQSEGKGKTEAKEGTKKSVSGAGEERARAGAGKGDGSDERRRRDENSRTPASDGQITYDIQDDDPVHFESPLLTLCASLRPLSETYIRQQEATAAGSSIQPPFHPRASTSRLPSPSPGGPSRSPLAPLDNDASGPYDVPPLLSDIEHAYERLVRAFLRLPSTLESEATTLAPIARCRDQLRRCLERDIGNIASFPSWARVALTGNAPAPSPSRRDKGKGPARITLPEEQMRRLKDEVGVAQIAIKAFTSIAKDSRLSKLFTDEDLTSILNTILTIPGTPNLSTTIHKDLYPFISWFLSTQRLPSTFVTPHLPLALTALSHTLTANDKLRQNLGEAIPAVSHLLTTHPREMLDRSELWFRPVANGLWDTGKRGTSVKVKALAALGVTAKALVMSDEEGGSGWSSRKHELAEIFSAAFHTILIDSPPDPNAKPDAPSLTYAHILEQQTEASLRPMTNGKMDESAWLWLINLLAVLPALLGQRFRKLEQKGIRPFVGLFNKFSDQPSSYMRTLTALIWNHVTRAFLTVPLQARNEIWIFRHDKKPLAVLTSIFEHRRAGDWKPVQHLSPARIEKHKANAQALAHAVVGMVTGFAIVLHSGPPPSFVPSTGTNKILSDVELAQFDVVFDRLVVPQLTSVVNAPYSTTPSIGWATLASLVRPRTEQDRLASMDQLVNTVLFSGAIAATKDPVKQELILRRALQATTQGRDVSAWGSQWTTSRVEKVLSLLQSLLGDWTKGESFSMEVVENSIIPVWRNLLLSFAELAQAPESDTFTAGVHRLINWIGDLLNKTPTKPPASGVSAGLVAHRFVELLCQVLGSRISVLPLAEATAQHRPWYFLASLVLDSPHSMPTTELEAEAYAAASLAVLALPLSAEDKRMILLAATTKLVSPESQLDSFVDCLYLDFGEKLSAEWAALLSQAECGLDTDALGQLTRLICAHPRSASWTDLSALLNVAIFEPILTPCPPKDSQLKECLATMTSFPSAPVANMRLLVSLVTASKTQSIVVQEALVELATSSLRSLFVDPLEGFVEPAVELLAAASNAQLARLYPIALEGLQPLVKLTAEGLAFILPILTIISRAFDATESDTQISSAVNVEEFVAFGEFWEATFDKTDLPAPAELVDALKVTKTVWPHPMGHSVGESQTQASQSMCARPSQEPASLEAQTLPAPGPGQRPRSSRATPVTITDSSAKADQSGQGYEADISTTSPLRTTLTSTSTSAHVPAAPSPSLCAPSITAVAGDVEVPQSPSLVEETPREIVAIRARASLASSEVLAQGPVQTSPEAANKGSSTKKRGPSPELGRPSSLKKKSRSPSVISDGDSDDAIVISAAPRSSQASASQGPRTKVKSKQRASSTTPPPIVEKAAAQSTSGKRRKAEPYVDVSVKPKAHKLSGRDERATKRSLSKASLSSSDNSAKKRRRKSSRVEPDVASKARPSSPPRQSDSPRSRSPSSSPPRAGSSSSSGINSPRDQAGEDAVRHLLRMPVDTVVRTAAKVGGSPRAAMDRLRELGEQAKLYFNLLSQSRGGGSA